MAALLTTIAALILLATPVSATPYRAFTDVTRLDKEGEKVIRTFAGSFRLILEQRGDPRPGDADASPGKCIVWLQFLNPDDTDHFGRHGVPEEPTLNGGFTDRRELVEAPLSGADVFDEHGELGVTSYLDSSRADLHWATRGGRPFTQDALEILTVAVDVAANGDCVAGVRSLFTPNLASRDVVDSRRVSEFTEQDHPVRLRGFPAESPTFTLFIEFLEAGTTLSLGGGHTVTMTKDLCALTLELNEAAAPFWASALFAFFDFRDDETRRFYILAQGGPEVSRIAIASSIPVQASIPWMSLTTEETLILKKARIDTGQGNPELEGTCFAEARTQFASTIRQLYR